MLEKGEKGNFKVAMHLKFIKNLVKTSKGSRLVFIFKSKGGKTLLEILTIFDKIVQHCKKIAIFLSSTYLSGTNCWPIFGPLVHMFVSNYLLCDQNKNKIK